MSFRVSDYEVSSLLFPEFLVLAVMEHDNIILIHILERFLELGPVTEVVSSFE